MAAWIYNSEDYTARNFAIIPEGDYRVTINSVTERLFNSGNEGFEIMLDVTNHSSKLWHYLVLDPNDPKKTNQRLGMFFDSFAIHDTDLSHYTDWVGRDGAVRVKHNQYNGEFKANVAFCLSRSQQKKFPDFNSSQTYQQGMTTNNSAPSNGQQNRFNGFSNHPAARMEFPEDFSF